MIADNLEEGIEINPDDIWLIYEDENGKFAIGDLTNQVYESLEEQEEEVEQAVVTEIKDDSVSTTAPKVS